MLGVARIAAIQAAKRTGELIPLCHPIALTRIAVEFERRPEYVRGRMPGHRGNLWGAPEWRWKP